MAGEGLTLEPFGLKLWLRLGRFEGFSTSFVFFSGKFFDEFCGLTKIAGL